MAKNKTKRVDSKQSTGRKRQGELLRSSKCAAHDREAVRTTLLEQGKYKHECWECILTPKRQVIVVTGPTIDLATIRALLLG